MVGWIKLHRQFRDSAIYTDSQAVHLWVHILFKASHKPNQFLHYGSMLSVNEGQFVTGRKKLSLETGINESKIERLLKVFQTEQMIEQVKTPKYRLISITKWSQYQDSEQLIEQQTNNKRTTNEQLANTIKNDKNDKNEKKTTNGNSIELPSWLTKELWNEFKKHRVKIKAPMTTYSEKLAFNKLEKFKTEGHNPVELIDLAIEKGWKSFYLPTDRQQNQQQSQKGYAE